MKDAAIIYQELIDRIAEQLCYSGIIKINGNKFPVEELGIARISAFNGSLYWELEGGISLEIDPNEGLIAFDSEGRRVECHIL